MNEGKTQTDFEKQTFSVTKKNRPYAPQYSAYSLKNKMSQL